MKSRTTFWLGLLIGLLLSLLVAAVAILAVPRLRPLVGIDATDVMQDVTPVPTTEPVPAASSITESDNIRVTSPAANQSISSPVYVTGEARVFEGVVELRMLDSDGAVLAQTFTTTRAADVGLFGPFDISLAFTPPRGTVGTLEVYWTSPATGTEVDVVSIPVMF